MYCKPKPMPTESAVKTTASDVRSALKPTFSAKSRPRATMR
ncbi:MAG: hypothetical protein ABR554_00670 [Pyrinomonadaceae bacterium]